jgi:broad specificity phosphatase PhoE
MAKIYLIRHGQASAGSSNYDVLSPKGIEQTRLLGQYFNQHQFHIDRIISGPLERQKDSAKHFINGKKIKNSFDIFEGFKEHDGYRMFKKHFPILSKSDPVIKRLMEQAYQSDQPQNVYFKMYERVSTQWVNGELEISDPEFENWPDFKSRVADCWEQTCQSIEHDENLAIFSSAGPVTMIVGHLLGLMQHKIMELSWIVHNASVTEISISKNGQKRLQVFNNISHFHGKNDMITLV